MLCTGTTTLTGITLVLGDNEDIMPEQWKRPRPHCIKLTINGNFAFMVTTMATRHYNQSASRILW